MQGSLYYACTLVLENQARGNFEFGNSSSCLCFHILWTHEHLLQLIPSPIKRKEKMIKVIVISSPLFLTQESKDTQSNFHSPRFSSEKDLLHTCVPLICPTWKLDSLSRFAIDTPSTRLRWGLFNLLWSLINQTKQSNLHVAY